MHPRRIHNFAAQNKYLSILNFESIAFFTWKDLIQLNFCYTKHSWTFKNVEQFTLNFFCYFFNNV